jgi:MFS family permease
VLVRALSIGLLGVVLSFHLVRAGFDTAEIGYVVSAGLWGMAGTTLAVGAFADRVGRRRSLVALALLGAAGVVAASFASSPLLACLAAFVGMVNGAGRERGALPTLEQAALAGTTTPATRTKTFAVYSFLDDGGLAIGGVLVGVESALGSGAPPASVERAGILGAAGLLVVAAALYATLSRGVEAGPAPARRRLSPQTRGRVVRIASLFALDGLGGGLILAGLVSQFFEDRFHVDAGTWAFLFFGSRVLNAVSHFGAAWLAKRIGLVNTMVFTHIPSSVLLFTVTLATSFPAAAALFLLREGLVEMDVPTRQSYLMGIVRPEERTAVNAVVNVVRIVSWAVGAALAGWLMKDVAIGLPLALAAGLKITYDVLLWVSFRGTRPPEESGAPQA